MTGEGARQEVNGNVHFDRRYGRFLQCIAMMLAACSAALLAATNADAHNPDTSYARFKISRQFVESQFTYDLTTLNLMVPGIDADGDRRITAAELQVKVPAIYDFLRRHIRFEINEAAGDVGEAQPTELAPDAGGAVAEKDYHAASSLVPFTFRRVFTETINDVRVEFQFFATVGPTHTVLGVFDEAGDPYDVTFKRDEPEWRHDLITPLAPPETPTTATGMAERSEQTTAGETAPPPRRDLSGVAWRNVRIFFRFGVEHIFLGFDHILFLLSLIVVSRPRELLAIVTSFTVAHSITLILAALHVVDVPSNYVEIAIAATIVYTAAENFWIKNTRRRWTLTFAFGLIHGLGFANVLGEMQLPTEGLVRSLVAFNVGVEAGQLAIVVALLPLTFVLSRWKHGKAARLGISAAIGLCGLGWLLDRAVGLGVMPF